MSLPVGGRVLIDLLNKLYTQSVKGRRESALPRGMSPAEQQVLPEVLELLRKHGGAERRVARGNRMWHPRKTFAEHALKIIRLPEADTHPLVKEALKIG